MTSSLLWRHWQVLGSKLLDSQDSRHIGTCANNNNNNNIVVMCWALVDWLIESHQTDYRSYRGRRRHRPTNAVDRATPRHILYTRVTRLLLVTVVGASSHVQTRNKYGNCECIATWGCLTSSQSFRAVLTNFVLRMRTNRYFAIFSKFWHRHLIERPRFPKREQ